MKVIDILVAIANEDKKINGLKFEFIGEKYFIENFRIYYINEYGFKNELRNIGICFLDEDVKIIEFGEVWGSDKE